MKKHFSINLMIYLLTLGLVLLCSNSYSEDNINLEAISKLAQNKVKEIQNKTKQVDDLSTTSNNTVNVYADFDCDGSYEPTIWDDATGKWSIYRYYHWPRLVVQWGLSGDIPVAANYDWDCPEEIAIWRPSTGNWHISSNNQSWPSGEVVVQWGLYGDFPIPGDYDGDGIDEIAIYRPSTGKCHVSLHNQSWPNGEVVVDCD